MIKPSSYKDEDDPGVMSIIFKYSWQDWRVRMPIRIVIIRPNAIPRL